MNFETSPSVSDAVNAKKYLDKLVNHKCKVEGLGLDEAFRVIGRNIGVGAWSLWGIYNRRSKKPGCVTKLRLAYVALLERQVAEMLAEIDRERDLGRSDDDLEGIGIALASLKAQIARKKALWSAA